MYIFFIIVVFTVQIDTTVRNPTVDKAMTRCTSHSNTVYSDFIQRQTQKNRSNQGTMH